MNDTRPPHIAPRIEWNRKSRGWDCRLISYSEGRKKRRHLGHLGGRKWVELQQQHTGEALVEALRQWLAERSNPSATTLLCARGCGRPRHQGYCKGSREAGSTLVGG